jgi:hypothetical protein
MARRLTYIVEPFSVDGRFWRIVLKNSPVEAQGVR